MFSSADNLENCGDTPRESVAQIWEIWGQTPRKAEKSGFCGVHAAHKPLLRPQSPATPSCCFIITHLVRSALPSTSKPYADDYCALMISCAARRAAVREAVRREGAERPFAASAARLAARDASHSSHVILMTSFSGESATLHLLAQRALKQIGSRLNIGYSSFDIKFHVEYCIKNLRSLSPTLRNRREA